MSIRRKIGLSQIALEKEIFLRRPKYGAKNVILSVVDSIAAKFPMHFSDASEKCKLYEELAEIYLNSSYDAVI